MPAPATHPRRLALVLAAITALTLGTVSASTAAASDTSGATDDPPSSRPERPDLPGPAIGYHPTDNAPDDVNEANDDFAACMRGEGQTYFPDFHAEKGDDGSIRLRVTLKADRGEPTDVAAKEYRKAIKKCAPILKAAGITLPSTPQLPGRPGKGKLPEPPALHEHFRTGEESPSLTGTA